MSTGYAECGGRSSASGGNGWTAAPSGDVCAGSALPTCWSSTHFPEQRACVRPSAR